MTDKRVVKLLKQFPKDFSGRKSVTKRELRDYVAKNIPDSSEKEFRATLYQLENNLEILASGSGIFLINEKSDYVSNNQSSLRTKYEPSPSAFIQGIIFQIKNAFPNVDFTIWETKELNQFIVHQTFYNLVILECEKDSVESLFNNLSEFYPSKTFLSPDRLVFERYILQQKEALIISKSVTQTPKGRKKTFWPYAKIEKILVDIFTNKDLFIFFQGKEMVNIFKGVFKKYLVDERSLFRYAGRRHVAGKIKDFIFTKTNIELLTISR